MVTVQNVYCRDIHVTGHLPSPLRTRVIVIELEDKTIHYFYYTTLGAEMVNGHVSP